LLCTVDVQAMLRRWTTVLAPCIAAVIVVVAMRPRLTRMAMRSALHLRIWRLHCTLRALAAHAAEARAISRAYAQRIEAHADDADATLRERQHALRAIQRRALAGLEAARAAVDANLLELWKLHTAASTAEASLALGARSSVAARGCAQRARIELAAESVHALRLLGAAGYQPTAPPPRHHMLHEEQRALAALERRTAERPQQPRALRRALRRLRALESSLDFQAELLDAQRRCAAVSGYSASNFAYGSTPLHSWLAVFESAPLRAAVAAKRHELCYVVLGSSLGSLVLYGACVFGVRSHGIELLPELAAAAVRVAAAAGVEHASFECADMLTCDLSASDVVLLASQCWDARLVAAVRWKLLDELLPGALVLDYTAALGEETDASRSDAQPNLPASATHAPRRGFALQCTVRAPVSWDATHCFWVWRVVAL
jgi:hypothetical protein